MNYQHQNLESDENYAKDIDLLKNEIVTFNDWPKPGVSFKDTFSLLKNPITFEKIIDIFCDLITKSKADVVVGLEARGFPLGGAICYKLKLPFVPVRKKNKLPGPLKTVHYTLEYGEDILQIQEGAIKSEQRVVIVDDVIATGGSVKATIELVQSTGAIVSDVICVIGCEGLGWENKLKESNVKVSTLFKFQCI